MRSEHPECECPRWLIEVRETAGIPEIVIDARAVVSVTIEGNVRVASPCVIHPGFMESLPNGTLEADFETAGRVGFSTWETFLTAEREELTGN